ncbi:hypothetical protein HDU76_002129 [Blyttiomyces sp. JEL0837]|nr:hypothetical protein HDU76_002129 [Blyttiomyces sp. JEL0837]
MDKPNDMPVESPSPESSDPSFQFPSSNDTTELTKSTDEPQSIPLNDLRPSTSSRKQRYSQSMKSPASHQVSLSIKDPDGTKNTTTDKGKGKDAPLSPPQAQSSGSRPNSYARHSVTITNKSTNNKNHSSSKESLTAAGVSLSAPGAPSPLQETPHRNSLPTSEHNDAPYDTESSLIPKKPVKDEIEGPVVLRKKSGEKRSSTLMPPAQVQPLKVATGGNGGNGGGEARKESKSQFMSPYTLRTGKIRFYTKQTPLPRWIDTAREIRFVLRVLQICFAIGAFASLAVTIFKSNFKSSILALGGVNMMCFTSISSTCVSAACIVVYLFPAYMGIAPHRHYRMSRVELGIDILWLGNWLGASAALSTFGNACPQELYPDKPCIPWDVSLSFGYAAAVSFFVTSLMGFVDLKAHGWGFDIEDRPVGARGGWKDSTVVIDDDDEWMD